MNQSGTIMHTSSGRPVTFDANEPEPKTRTVSLRDAVAIGCFTVGSAGTVTFAFIAGGAAAGVLSLFALLTVIGAILAITD